MFWEHVTLWADDAITFCDDVIELVRCDMAWEKSGWERRAAAESEADRGELLEPSPPKIFWDEVLGEDLK